MNKFTKILKLAAFVAFLGGCDTPEETPEAPDLTVLPVDPKIPTGLDDCRVDAVYADQSQARLMTRYEFDNTIEDLLGIQSTVARDTFPSENANSGFENNSDSHIVSPLYVRKLMEAAEGLSLRALSENGATLIGCDLAEAGCGHQFVEGFLDTAFRRPVEPEELQIFIDLYDTVEAESDAETATQRVIETTLQSPQFLYRVELSDDHAPGDLVPVTPHELAQRLSYFLWGTMPDQSLRDAADSGDLANKREVERQVNRMIADPKMARNVEQFYRQWLSLDSLETMVKDDVVYPDWNPSVSEDWKKSLYAYVNHVHATGGDVKTLLSSPTIFLTEQLAPIYGERPQTGLHAYNANPDERAGLLTQPAVMALLGYPNQSSPIHRGIFVRERLLCQKLPPPPANIEIEAPDPDPTMTTREIFAEHSENQACAGCHVNIDPIGFGFENYDGMGRYRSVENGLQVDASGGLFNTLDPTIEGDFDGAVELSKRLAEAGEVEDCIADHWFMFAMGRPETESDLCSADGVRTAFSERGNFEDLFLAITTSDSFRFRTVQTLEEE